MVRSAKIKKKKFEVPPEGEDWLWWHPEEPEDLYDSWGVIYQQWTTERAYMRCDKCDVRWYQEVLELHWRCWCCGKFKRKKKI